MRAFDPEIFNNNGSYKIIERLKKSCEKDTVNAYFQNNWVMLPTKKDAEDLASEIMRQITEEFGEASTIRLTGEILWEISVLETEDK